ncbi:ribosomal RNA large subunit methyltransferase J [Kwoniella heveanensis CBS 569]|nr:ribosomal RNA large subunit methyltransferase J [Kwoniella heveanensis CBS 569]
MRFNPASLKSSASSSRWLARQSRDPFVRQRQAQSQSQQSASNSSEGGAFYRARSSFKLLSLAKKHPIILSPNRTKTVVDLGAAPGGWSQVASNLLKSNKARIWALDILSMEKIPNVDVIRGDFLSEEVRDELRERMAEVGVERRGVDTVLSDMMAPMTGNRTRDVGLSLELCAAATVFARDVLRVGSKDDEEITVKGRKVFPGGNLVIKYFAHPDMDEFRKLELEPWFGKVTVEKPKESRSESSEAYWVCLGFKGDPANR